MDMSILAPTIARVLRYSSLSRTAGSRGTSHIPSRAQAARIEPRHEAPAASSAASAAVRTVARWIWSEAEGGLACQWELAHSAS